jgi:hypothetical protein
MTVARSPEMAAALLTSIDVDLCEFASLIPQTPWSPPLEQL